MNISLIMLLLNKLQWPVEYRDLLNKTQTYTFG